MGIFGKKQLKCARCQRVLHDHTEEDVRSAAPIVGLALRESMHVTCSACKKNYCVRCMESAGTCRSDLGKGRPGWPAKTFVILWCTSCHNRMMSIDLPAAHPALQSLMAQAYPDLKAAQLEALTRLTHQPLGEATYAVRGFLSDKDFIELVNKVRPIDPGLADYLSSRCPPNTEIDQLTYPGLIPA